MPFIRTRLSLVLLTLLVCAFSSVNADESSPESPTEDPTEQASDPRVSFYHSTTPLWKARIRAHCGLYHDEEVGQDTTCLGNTLGALVMAQDITAQTSEEQNQNPVPENFWNDYRDLINALTQSVPFHPLCLDKLPMTPLGGSDLEGRTATCDNTQTADILVRESGWILSSFADYEDGSSGGWAAYQVFERIEVNSRGTFLWIEATQNTGGTGNFDKIWLLYLPPEQTRQQTRLDWIFEIGGGDRCNDGKSTIENVQPGVITYNHAATPYRLLNPIDEDNTFLESLIRMVEEESEATDGNAGADDPPHATPGGPFMNWLAYDDVVNCAICCAGEITKTVDLESGESRVEGIAVDPEIFDMDFFAQPALAECGASWLASFQALAPETGPIAFGLDAWLAKRDELIEACKGVLP